MRVFGPIPSRRLGQSLGINNIPTKTCTYGCVYCQVGRTLRMTADRGPFFRPQELVAEVQEHLMSLGVKKERIDYLTIVPEGEPTLDAEIGVLIKELKTLGLPVAVITNAGLLDKEDVRLALGWADWVSVKVDSVTEDVWHKIDRPHGKLRLQSILEGIRTFADQYKGKLMTETMLVHGLNDTSEDLKTVADFISRIGPTRAYLSIPTRPPDEKWVKAPDEATITKAFQIFSSAIANVEYLIGYEGNKFASTGNIAEDILSITAVHPMREDAVKEFLEKGGVDFTIIENLTSANRLALSEYQGHRFYTRKIHKN